MVLAPSHAFRLSRLRSLPHVYVRPTLAYRSYRYREQQEKVARVKDETIRAIIKNSTEIAEMKEAVARQLKYIQDVVEANK